MNNVNTFKIKRLTYAYASSPHSIKYNNHRGCWLVQAPNILLVFQDWQRWEALAAFEALDYPIDTVSSFTRNSVCFLDSVAA